MESLNFDASILTLIVVIVSLGKLVQVVFATLRICTEEYFAFRKWLADAHRERDKTEER
jgi:hypothetical protein